MKEYIDGNYKNESTKKKLSKEKNICHIIIYNEQNIGFSKIILNATHPTIVQKNAAKLDRIYLLKEYHELKLGFELLEFN